MEFLSEYGLFLAKTITFVIAIIIVITVIIGASVKGNRRREENIEIEKINEKYDEYEESIKLAIADPELAKQEQKEKKVKDKAERKASKEQAKKRAKQHKELVKTNKDVSIDSVDESSEKKRVFFTQFDGDIKASATEQLREVITAILSVAKESDEIVIDLESQGGMVHSYGLAASQLARITQRGIPLTVCVDKVAASGGYMMACVADKIVAAPFAIIGSIGVVAQLPNFHKILKKNDIDYEMLTAGEYKRTLTMFGENTDKGRQKFVEDLEDTHVLFKDFIRDHRSIVNVEEVATGEIWFGKRALENKLIDEVQTSDEYLFAQKDTAEIFMVSMAIKKSLQEKLGLGVEAGVERLMTRWYQRLTGRFFT